MSEPLNDFLESVEAYVEDRHMTDAEVGERVRVAWENMKQAEVAEDAAAPSRKTNMVAAARGRK